MTEPSRSGFTVQIDGRTVVVRTGSKTQTVNVCTPDNVAGRYEARFRLDLANAVGDESDLTARTSIAELRTWLLERNADEEGPTGGPLPPRKVVPADPFDSWVADAVAVVDAALDELVEGFVEDPYRHRVEHSLHIELVSALMSSALLGGLTAIGTSGRRTQLVHKEWPETSIRGDRGKTIERRGLFDVVVLAPRQLAGADLDQFTAGRIAPPIVVELGLGYGLQHLEGDIAKLRNSAVAHGRIVHLSLLPSRDTADVERVLGSVGTDATSAMRGAYGYHDRRGRRAIKRLGDAGVDEVR